MHITKFTPASKRDASLGGALAGDVGGVIGATTVTGIQGVPVSSTPPTDGQELVYVAADGQWEPQDEAPSSGGFVPTYVAPGATFTVPALFQALWAVPIDCDGTLDIDGVLVEVS